MSLINCPECGREKVSDTAIACPDCGFAIREFFQNKQDTIEKNDRPKDDIDIETILYKMKLTYDDFYIRYVAYWYHESFGTYKALFVDKVPIEQVCDCSKTYLGEYEFIDYTINNIDSVFHHCECTGEFDKYNDFISSLVSILNNDKYSEFFSYGTMIYFHSSIHIEKLNREVIMSLAKLTAEKSYTIWTSEELSVLFHYLKQNDIQECFSYFGEKDFDALSDGIDMASLYNEWLSCKKNGRKFDSSIIDKYCKKDLSSNSNITVKKSSQKESSEDSDLKQNSIGMPPEPTFSVYSLLGIIIGIIFLSVSIDKLFVNDTDIYSSTPNDIPLGIALLLYSIAIIFSVLYFYYKSVARYNLAKKDLNAYKVLIKNEQISKDNKPEMPNKPIFSKWRVMGILIGIGMIILSFLVLNLGNDNDDNYIIPFLYLFIVGLSIICVVLYFYWKALSRYNLAKNNYDEYQKLIKEERIHAIQNYKATVAERERKLSQTPKCPVCGSRDIKNISTINPKVVKYRLKTKTDKRA